MNPPTFQWINAARCGVCFTLITCVILSGRAADFAVLKPSSFAHYIEHFNSMEDENFTNTIPNADAWAWMQKEIPLFECPDREVEEMYYFRWWSYRKHLVQTTNGWVVTEFLTPVHHGGSFNTISCATGFHIAEGRWLRDRNYLDDYVSFWLRGNEGKPQAHFHKYSSWFAAAVYDRYLATGDKCSVTNLLGDLVADYQAWEREHQTTNGLFWQFDVRDGMEESISGSRKDKNLRPTINAYMYANAQAIAAMARLAGNGAVAATFDAKAEQLKTLVQEKLWDAEAGFFEVRHEEGTFSGAREELGFIPWMFNLPDKGEKYEAAWRQLEDAKGFAAPAGITTAERRHPQFRSHGVGNCEWDGAVWPFGTCETLYGLANALHGGGAGELGARDYYDNFLTYVHSQHSDGKPYIGEYHDEVTGDWINGKGGRSRYYNHSTFADLIITGVVGLQPRADATVEICPLLPAGTWNWFCLDDVPYHGHMLTICWDKDGTHYGYRPGFIILADGKEIAHGEKLAKLSGKLP
jgi:hypothetical protein